MVRRALIVGLDGATWDVIDPLLARGELPHLGEIVRRGASARLRSTIPPVTAAAWPSIITGMNPGRHGYFVFEALDHTAYGHSGKFSSSDRLAGRTIFDYVGAQGGRVLAAAVPMTYPAWPINGRMLAGYPTPRGDRFFTEPPEWAEELARHIPTRRRDRSRETMDVRTPAEWLDYARRLHEQVGTYFCELIEREPFDLVMLVDSMTDNVQHRFFHLHQRAGGPAPDDPIDTVYRLCDELVGKLGAAIGDDWLVVLVSDHGGGPRAERLFYVNAWLREQGFLAAARRPRQSLMRTIFPTLKRAARLPLARQLWRRLSGQTQRSLRKLQVEAGQPDWSKTQAYFVKLCSPIAGINVNLRGREPNGIVAPGSEYETVRERVIAALRGLKQPGTSEPLVVNVWKREELYSGPFVESAPDILFQVDERYEPRIGLEQLWGRTSDTLHAELTGDHRMDGILAFAGRGVFRSGLTLSGASVVDVAPTLLHALGLPIPENMDGRVLTEAFEAEFLAANPVRTGPPLEARPVVARAYTAEEEAGIAAQLRALGYVE